MSTEKGEEIFGIGERLKEERVRLGMSQAAFGTRIGTTDRTIKKYEGNETSPRATELCVASSLGVDVFYVITGRRIGYDAIEQQAEHLRPATQLAARIAEMTLTEEDAELLEATARRLSVKC